MTPTKFHHAGLDWIPHTFGDPMPCPPDTRVRVLLRYEQEETGYDGEQKLFSAVNWDWAERGSCAIVGWHPVEEQPSLARRILDLLEAGDIEQAKHELRKELK